MRGKPKDTWETWETARVSFSSHCLYLRNIRTKWPTNLRGEGRSAIQTGN